MSELMSVIDKRNKKMIGIINRLISGDGVFTTRMPEINFIRSSKHIPRSAVMYEPSIVIILQGKKIGTMGERLFIYDKNEYLTLTIPMPFECETIGSPDEPLIGILIKVTPTLITEILLQMDNPSLSGEDIEFISTQSLTMHQSGILVRLVESLEHNEPARILSQNILREFLYNILMEKSGDNLKFLALNKGRHGQIAKVLSQMHAHYANNFDMADLAKESGMSVSAFHSHFKAITHSTPLQYLKEIRLHKARLMMLHDNMTASRAASIVGYSSNSQFSREFKRLFGDAPTIDSAKTKRIWLKEKSG
ncbi:AraC family transcriptional regulator [Sodalis sp. RH16]|jgi:AraC-like DNA-binding protein|uniref:AraC family transcriptional regulator n=1 Tax=Sodalis sp. RH16 TaxID=3394331 RepID=UPI0039B60D55